MFVKKRAPDSGPVLDTHAQIAIGVIIPVVVLLGGLLFFIWYTERQRRRRVGEAIPEQVHIPSRPKINSYLHRSSKAVPGLRTSTIDVDAIEIARPRASDAKMHELEDTGKVELQEMQKTLSRLNHRMNRADEERDRTTSPRNINDRNDSAIEAAAARLESRDTDRSRSMERKELDTTKMEYNVPMPADAKRYSNARDTYRSSLQPAEYRSSLKPGMSKREARVASSRYSKEVRYSKDVEARFSKDAAARYSANADQLKDLHRSSVHTNGGGTTTPGGRVSAHGTAGFTSLTLHTSRSRDSNLLNASSESIEQHFSFANVNSSNNSGHLPMQTTTLATNNIKENDGGCDSPTVSDISRPTNRNSALSAVDNKDRSSQRWSGVGTVPGELPSWMKRLSVQDTVEGKWRSDGEIVPPINPRTEGDGGSAVVSSSAPIQPSHLSSEINTKLLLLSAAEHVRLGRPSSRTRLGGNERSYSPGTALGGDETDEKASSEF